MKKLNEIIADYNSDNNSNNFGKQFSKLILEVAKNQDWIKTEIKIHKFYSTQMGVSPDESVPAIIIPYGNGFYCFLVEIKNELFYYLKDPELGLESAQNLTESLYPDDLEILFGKNILINI